MLIKIKQNRDAWGLVATVVVKPQTVAEQAACLTRLQAHRHTGMLVLDSDYDAYCDALDEGDLAAAHALLRQGRVLWDQPFTWSERQGPRQFVCELRLPDTALTQALLHDIEQRPCLQGVVVGLEHLTLEHHNLELSRPVAAAAARSVSVLGTDRSA